MDRRAAVLLAFLTLLALNQPVRASSPAAPVPDLVRTPVQTVAISPFDQMLAGTFGNGIFASHDGGKTWVPKNTDLSNKNVFALTVKPGSGIFAGTFGGGVYRSLDDQASGWVQLNSGLGCVEVICLVVDSNGGLYAGTSMGEVYYSRDDGKQWASIGDVGEYVNAVAVNRAGDIFVGTLHGMYRSVDRGKTWEEANAGLSCRDVWSLSVTKNGHVFAATNGGGVFRSSDGGESWVQVNAGLSSRNAGSVALCPNGNLFVGTDRGVFVSTNEGEMWSNFVKDPSNNAVRCLTIGLDGQLLVGAHWVDIFETNPVQPLPEDLGSGM